MQRLLESKKIQKFEFHLRDEEMSAATIEKYMRDVKRFASFACGSKIDKQTVLEYKKKLGEAYAVASEAEIQRKADKFRILYGF